MAKFQNGLTREVREVSVEDDAWFAANPPWVRIPTPEPAKPAAKATPKTKKA